jgi:hypothetical protein
MMSLLTDKQLVAEFNLPSIRTVRTMRQQGLPAIRLGKSYLYDTSDVQAFIAARKVTQCRGRTEDRISSSSNSAEPFTSIGASMEQRASDQQALRTVEKLKLLSPPSSKSAEAPSEAVRAIQVSFPSQKH